LSDTYSGGLYNYIRGFVGRIRAIKSAFSFYSVSISGELIMTETATTTEKTTAQKQGKYLTFAIADEEYGLEILKVREIIGYMDITPVPQTPAYVKGVINLRGQVIPVIDLRSKLGMQSAEVTEETCIIVVEASRNGQKNDTGLVIDRVQEVLYIAGEQIQETPEFGSSIKTDFILGLGKVGKSVKILLDIDKVLAGATIGGINSQCDCSQGTPNTVNNQ
jgi:purine-binding chemotaxis protein CheW